MQLWPTCFLGAYLQLCKHLRSCTRVTEQRELRLITSFFKVALTSAKGVRVWHVSCEPLRVLQGKRTSGEMLENSTHRSKCRHPISLGALGREGKPEGGSFPRCCCQHKAQSCAWAGFQPGSRSLLDHEILFYNSFNRRKDQKVSGVHWKFICLQCESAFLLSLVNQQKCNMMPPHCSSSDFKYLLLHSICW